MSISASTKHKMEVPLDTQSVRELVTAIDLISDVTAGTAELGKALVLDASGAIDSVGTVAVGTFTDALFDDATFTAATITTLTVGTIKDAHDRWELFDDFNYQAIDETNGPWILNSGTDPQAIDPAILNVGGIGSDGLIQVTAGNDDGTMAVDGSQIVCAIPVFASFGGLGFECRLTSLGSDPKFSVNVGLTDVTTLEEPFSISGGTVTAVATNAVAFVYDYSATTKQWYACGVDGTTKATGLGATGIAPTLAYQVLRCEIDADGEGARFYIDGTLVKTLTAKVTGASGRLHLTVTTNGRGNSAAIAATVDYLRVFHTRD